MTLTAKAVILGEPASPYHQINPVELVRYLESLDLRASLSGPMYFEDTLAQLNAIPSPQNGWIGFVLDDGTNSGVYAYSTGGWAKTAELPLGFEALSASTVKSLYESNDDTNAFTDADKTRLSNVRNTYLADTLSDLNSVTNVPLGSVGYVTKDLNVTLNGVYYRNNVGGTDTWVLSVEELPSALVGGQTDYDLSLASAQAKWLSRAEINKTAKPKAAVVVLLGQSNNAPRGTAISGVVSRDVFMPFAGNATAYFPFNATNATWTMSWSDVASAVQHQEGASETPCSGVAIGLLGAEYQRIYICSAAIGARSLEVLNVGGPANNVHGLIMRLCDLARDAGYEPEVMFDVHHGEANASAGTSEADYYALGMAYYSQARAHAAHAMDRPEYDAPIVFHTPIAGGYSGQMVPIQKAIVRLAKDIPNAILAGGSFQFPTEVDRVHQEETGYRMRGEQGGYLLREWSQGKGRHQSLHIVEAKWNGTTCTVLFNKEIVRDTSVDYGTNLNTSFALAGLEFLDDGSYVQITGVSVQGRAAVLTLASAPTGTTQLVRIASQTITGTLTAGSNNLPGTQIRSTEAQRLSIYDYTFDIGDFATPQQIEATP